VIRAGVVDLLEQVLARPYCHWCQQEVELVDQVVRHEDLVQRPVAVNVRDATCLGMEFIRSTNGLEAMAV
jgi:hypothetical protein